MSAPTRIGVIGLGVMGRAHIEAYRLCAARGLSNRLVAVADGNIERLRGENFDAGNLASGKSERLFDPQLVRGYADARELIADRDVDLISICTPTRTHVDLAIAALRAGKHVLVEKPVALESREVERLLAVARESRSLCMPAMCMRFWPGWDTLLEAVRSRRYGSVASAVFRRLGTRPSWSAGFYDDPAQSGGALFDLHIHDADFVRACFGDPTSVSSTGSLDHVTTLYRFANGPAHVVAEGGWNHTSGFPFHMQFIVAFEQATLEFDLSREPKLTLARDGTNEPVAIASGMGYEGEVAHLLGAIQRGSRALDATLEDALALTRLLERERAELNPSARTD